MVSNLNSIIGLDKVDNKLWEYNKPKWSKFAKVLINNRLMNKDTPISFSNETGSFVEPLPGSSRVEIDPYFLSKIIFDRNICSADDQYYKSFLLDTRKADEDKKIILISSKIISAEGKRVGNSLGIPHKAEQNRVINIDINTLLNQLESPDSKECFRQLWSLMESTMHELIIQAKSGRFGNFFSSIPLEDQSHLIKKIGRIKSEKLVPYINDACILVFSLYQNIFTNQNTILVSNDGDMPLLASVFINSVVPQFFSLKIHEKLGDGITKIGEGDKYYLSAKGYITDLYRMNKDSSVTDISKNKEISILWLANLQYGTLSQMTVTEAMFRFLKFDSQYIKGKTTIIEYSVAMAIDPIEVLRDLENNSLTIQEIIENTKDKNEALTS